MDLECDNVYKSPCKFIFSGFINRLAECKDFNSLAVQRKLGIREQSTSQQLVPLTPKKGTWVFV